VLIKTIAQFIRRRPKIAVIFKAMHCHYWLSSSVPGTGEWRRCVSKNILKSLTIGSLNVRAWPRVWRKRSKVSDCVRDYRQSRLLVPTRNREELRSLRIHCGEPLGKRPVQLIIQTEDSLETINVWEDTLNTLKVRATVLRLWYWRSKMYDGLKKKPVNIIADQWSRVQWLQIFLPQ